MKVFHIIIYLMIFSSYAQQIGDDYYKPELKNKTYGTISKNWARKNTPAIYFAYIFWLKEIRIKPRKCIDGINNTIKPNI